MTWETVERAWLDGKRRRSGGENTARAYGLALRQFLEHAGCGPGEASAGLAEAWVRSLEEAGRQPSTVAQKLSALASFYGFAQREYGALWPAERLNPFAGVQRPRVEPFGRAAWPSTAEVRAILGAIDVGTAAGRRDYALLYTLVVTCRRCREVLHLRWEDLAATRGGHYQFVYRAKGGRLRVSPLHRSAYQAIVAYLEAAGRPVRSMQGGDYVWAPLRPQASAHLNGGGPLQPNRPISGHQANMILRRHAARAGVPRERAHVHGLRHAGAHIRLEEMRSQGTVDYLELRDLLGHSSIATTQIYVQSCHAQVEDPAGEAVARRLRGEL